MSEQEQFQSEDPNAGFATPIMDLIAAGVLALISIWMIVESLRLPVPGSIATAPGLLPFAVSATLLVMALFLGAGALARRSVVKPAADRIELPESFRPTMMLGAILIVYVLGLQFLVIHATATIGSVRLVVGAFEVASVITLTAIMRIYWRGALWLCLLIALGWVGLLSIVFRTIFHIQLP